jgi:hypothetical protein
VSPTATGTHTPSPTGTPTPVNPFSTGLKACSLNYADAGGDGNGFERSSGSACSNDSGTARDTNSGTSSASSCTSGDKDRHVFYGFGLNVPTDTYIQGIEVRTDARVDSSSGAPKLCVELSWDGGSSWTTPILSQDLTTTEQTLFLGGSNYLWGEPWAPSQVNGNNLRVRVTMVATSISRDFYLDYVAVNVTYAP